MNRTYTKSMCAPSRGAAAGGIALALVLTAGTVLAADCDGDGIDDLLQTYTWQATAPSPWNAPSSWLSPTGGVPGFNDLAVFDGSTGLGLPPYNVFLTTPRGVRGLNALNAQTTIDLSGLSLDVTGNLPGCRELLVGGQTGATLIVTGGGQLRSTAVRLADFAGSSGTLQIDGLLVPVTYMHFSPIPLVIGERGIGKLELSSSTLQHDGRLVLGEQAGSMGSLTALGTSQIRLSMETLSEVTVGSAGQGEIRLENDSLFNNNGAVSLVLGEMPTGVGELDLFQTIFAQTLAATNLEIGSLGSGLLRVRQGSSLTTPVSIRAAIGLLEGSAGEARITTGGFWQISGQPLEVGPGGHAMLNVGETAQVESIGGIIAHVDGVIGGSGVVSGTVQLPGGEIAPNGQFAITGDRQQLLFTDDLWFSALSPISGLPETGRMTFTLSTIDPMETMSAVVSGTASLDGTLRVATLPGLDPDQGMWYPVLEANILTGVFDAVQSPLLDNGLIAMPVYPGDDTVYVEFVDRGIGESDLQPPLSFIVPGNFTDGKVVDVTGDGFPDLVVLNDNGPGIPGEVLVAENLGTAVDGLWLGFSPTAVSFSTVGDQPQSLDIGDMNGDSHPDLVLLNAGPAIDQIRIRLNNPGQPGDFSALDDRAISVNGTPIDLVLGDINGDESLDVITIFERAFLRGTGGGVQTSGNNGGGFDDTDGDTGDDPGSVDTMGGIIPSGVVISSKGEDSAYMYETTNVTSSSTGMRGPQLPIFLTQIVPTGRDPANVYTDDIDGDGIDDVITSDRRSGTISVIRAIDGGPGEIVYDDAVSLKATALGDNSQPGSVVAVDVNGDGSRDLVFTATDIQGATGVRAILNLGLDDQGGMLFSQSRRLPGDNDILTTPVGLAVADLDQNGREDVIVLRVQGSGPSVTVQLAPDDPSCNAADLAEPFGVLDLADINTFVIAFISQDPIADLTGEGIFDLSDLSAFVSAFLSGCP